MARVLILRAAAAARRTADALRAAGHQPLTLPVSVIDELSPEAPNASAYAAVLVSSANAVAFAARTVPFDRRMLAVGTATAEALVAAGFSRVEAASSSGADLARLAAGAAADGPLLYLAGRVRTHSLEAGLAAAGVRIETLDVYDTRPLYPEHAEIEAALGGRSPDAVLVLSVGQAEGLGRIVMAAPDLFSPPLRILCLSPRIRASLPDTIEATVFVAADGELSNLLDLL